MQLFYVSLMYFVCFMFVSSLSQAVEGPSAKEIASKKGKVEKTDVLKWSKNTTAVKDYMKVRSEYYELSIPLKGYRIVGEGGESDPRKTAAWFVEREKLEGNDADGLVFNTVCEKEAMRD